MSDREPAQAGEDAAARVEAGLARALRMRAEARRALDQQFDAFKMEAIRSLMMVHRLR